MVRSKKSAKKTRTRAPEPAFEGRTYYLLSNTGADRRALFSSQADFDRFEAYLYLLNALESQRAANFFVGNREHEIFSSARGENLVAIGAYSFFGHGFQILATPLTGDGIAKFMQKLQTAYTMYFNAKYAHSGRLFHSAYRAEMIDTNDALKRAFAFVHLAPSALFDNEWEIAQSGELAKLVMRAMEYRYSSIGEYRDGKPVITEPSAFPPVLRRAKDAHSHYALWMKHRGAK